MGALRHGKIVQLKFRNSFSVEPLVEEPPQLLFGLPLKNVFQVVPRRALKLFFADESFEGTEKAFISQRLSQHVEDHGRFPIPDRPRGGVEPARESLKRKVVFGAHVVPVIDKDLLAVAPALPFLIFIKMIREIGGQTLGPIALLDDVHLVSKPLMKNFVT